MVEPNDLLKDKDRISTTFPDNVKLDTILASGGQGIVYSGSVSGQPAAIKIYFPGQMQTRVDREVEALSQFENPHIVKLLWAGQISIDSLILSAVATTLIQGQDLATRIASKPLHADEVGRLVHNISNAINTMWESRIVHRDLKPPNILARLRLRLTR